jgi:signal transduction histidine kinase
MPRLSLRVHIFSLLAAIVAVALAGGAMVLWYTHKADTLLSGVLDRNFAAYETAGRLVDALLEQRGLVTYYFLDGDPLWLERLERSRAGFETLLGQARALAPDAEAQALVGRVESGYLHYAQGRGAVLDLYRAGRRDEGAALHRDIRVQYARVLHLCQEHRALHEERMRAAGLAGRQRMAVVSGAALGFMPVALSLVGVLAFVLVRHVLRPIHSLAEAMDLTAPGPGNEITALGRRVRDLLHDVGTARHKLEKSREHLVQAEKWALTGKLAASVAHSIRNPLTSVKIRLFSLGRSLRLTDEQREDFEVITEEIGHIDAIARNFLDFSRPATPRKQQVDAVEVVRAALTLMRHRLESYGVQVDLRAPAGPCPVIVDPEQLKEVLVNLLVNACEAMTAMTGGGRVEIGVAPGYADPLGSVVVVRVADTGPGIPAALREQVFQPFFSSKEEGTGLGLAIARRIVEEHGGWITATSREGGGAQFSITLPAKEDGQWHRS